MLDVRRHRIADAARCRRPLGHHLGDDRLHGAAGEGRVADQHLVRRGTERVDVAAGADVALAHRLLGRHVGGRAERHAGLGHATVARLAGGEGDAEVGDQGAAVMQENVLRLDVAMDDAAAMGIVEGTRHLGGDAHGVGDRELLVANEAIAEGLALDEGHDVEEDRSSLRVGIAGTRVEERENVRVLEVGGGLDLREEAFGADDGGEFGAEDLDGDGAIVLQVVRQVHRGHAALAKLALDPVAVGEAGGECGGWGRVVGHWGHRIYCLCSPCGGSVVLTGQSPQRGVGFIDHVLVGRRWHVIAPQELLVVVERQVAFPLSVLDAGQFVVCERGE